MTDTPTVAAAASDATPAPTPEQIAQAQAWMAAAAAAKPLPQAMAELCASDAFKAGLTALSAMLALYPNEPSNDLSYAVMSMNRLIARYAA